MKWRTEKLGQLATFKNGINYASSDVRLGVPVFGVSNFQKEIYATYEDLDQVDESVVKPENLLKDKDILFVRSNGNRSLIGRSVFVRNPPAKITHSGFTIRCRFHTPDVDPRFFAYVFKTRLIIDVLIAYGGGTNINNLNQEILENLDVPLPSLAEQAAISEWLLKFDDLIEINRNRIRLLETLAREVYREWFVHFRFPGHEHIELVDSGHRDFEKVPARWEICKVGDLLAAFPKTKKIKTSELLQVGAIPVIDQSKQFIAGYTDDTTASIDVDQPVIIFGDHTRVLKLVQFPFARGADGTQVVVSKHPAMPQCLFYLALLNLDLSNHHYARHFKFLKESEILVPEGSISSEFETLALKIFRLVDSLKEACRVLEGMRDLLLPRVLSGEVDVQDLAGNSSPSYKRNIASVQCENSERIPE